MTEKQCFELINQWKDKTYLYKFKLTFYPHIYEEALQIFKQDYARWFPNDLIIDINKLDLTPQLHAILTYRIARLLYLNPDIDSTSRQKDILSNLGRMHSLSELYYSADIGYGLKINHGIGTIIGARCKVGNNCLLHQNVTLGDKHGGRPTLGNNCTVYAGATILGEVTIGNCSIIGANALVINSCPNNAIMVGIPAKNIQDGTSKTYTD